MGNLSPKAAYFTRGTGHDEYGNYQENPVNWKNMIDRIGKKFTNCIQDLPRTGSLSQRRRSQHRYHWLGFD